MSLEVSIERIATALEDIARQLETRTNVAAVTVENGNEVAPEPEPAPTPKPKRTRKKKEAAPDPQPATVEADEPPQQEELPVTQDQAPAQDLTPEDLDKQLMDLARGASPAVIKTIFDKLASVGAKNTRQVPDGRRQYVLDEATKAVKGLI